MCWNFEQSHRALVKCILTVKFLSNKTNNCRTLLPKPSSVLMRIRHYNLQIFCLGKCWGLEAIFCFIFLVKIRGVVGKSNLKIQEKERATPHNLTVSSESEVTLLFENTESASTLSIYFIYYHCVLTRYEEGYSHHALESSFQTVQLYLDT